MCGIAGELRWGGAAASVEAVAKMTGAMTARGPDAGGLVARGRVAFGHRRLRIIDLKESGEQPMVDADLGLTLVFNGCIYNYRELRRELEAEGYRFFSTSDTEVVLKAWHAWGRGSVRRMNGMFAFAVLERDSGRVTLARDRLGIKPLYLSEQEGGKVLRFASSLPALLEAGGVDTEIDEVALHHYMTFHAVVPPPRTILRGVRKLPPATLLEVDASGERREEAYWSLPFGPRDDERSLSPEDWRDAVLAGLRAAVRRRLVADVPVGVLLSGGLDSSLIVGLLAEAGERLDTFSIGFESVGEEAGDEFVYSDVVARRFETRHHKLRVDSRTFLPSLPGCISAMSEPMVSHDNIGFYLLSQEVSRHVRVVQSGQGADEIFAGYRWYPPLAGVSPEDAAGAYARVFFDRDHAEYAEAVDARFVSEDHSLRFVAERFGEPGAERALDRALRLDTIVMLEGDPVKRVDNMTMAFGLEARVPFLDHELVELAARVPAELKLAQGGKGVLKEAARLVVPHEVIDRPKGYFPVPALKYLRGPYLERVREAVLGPRARARAIFRREYVERLLAAPEAHITPLQGSKLWQVALLELWLDERGL